MKKQSGGDPSVTSLKLSTLWNRCKQFQFPVSLILSDIQHSARESPNVMCGCFNKTQDAVLPFIAMENHTTHQDPQLLGWWCKEWISMNKDIETGCYLYSWTAEPSTQHCGYQSSCKIQLTHCYVSLSLYFFFFSLMHICLCRCLFTQSTWEVFLHLQLWSEVGPSAVSSGTQTPEQSSSNRTSFKLCKVHANSQCCPQPAAVGSLIVQQLIGGTSCCIMEDIS